MPGEPEGPLGRPRTALITGIAGQDGSYLAEFLLEEGYQVVGAVRGSSEHGLGHVEALRGRLREVRAGCNLLEPEGLAALVAEVRPDELYHLASRSFVPSSWRDPARTFSEVTVATGALLEAVRASCPAAHVFVAASGAMFGAAAESPQREDTAANPRNPYAIAKLAVHQLTGRMREHDGLFACSGILYNHESERRAPSYVTRKITRAVAQIKLGLAQHVTLGDLDAVRDWSFAGDIMRGAWMMLQQDAPEDFILASGVGHTVRELAQCAFAHAGLDAGDYIQVDASLRREPEATPLIGDASRAMSKLKWQPTLTFEQLIGRMVDADLEALGEAPTRTDG
ncbi:MAG: GDP-mannose 4,6-dehydratase [Solirubrobacteraceae bacterium]